MRKFFTPTQDATLYEEYGNRNAGLDEILEVGKTDEGTKRVRSLVQFDINTISASLAARTIPLDASFELLLYVATATNLKLNQQVQLCQVSQSWVEGTGYFYQEVRQANDGVTWTQNQSGSYWSTGSAGGSVVSTPLSSSLTIPVSDLSFDITVPLKTWVSGTLSNYGFLVKFPDSDEADHANEGHLALFSKDTHTVYPPQLIAKWNDQVYQTGSLAAYPTSSLVVVPASLKPSYRKGETVRVNLAVRTRYPLKTFDTVFTNYDGLKYLPATSYFSIVDEQSNTVIIPFDQYSLVSCDNEGAYIKFNVEHMYPLRYYRLLLKVEHDGLVEIFDDNSIFTLRQ